MQDTENEALPAQYDQALFAVTCASINAAGAVSNNEDARRFILDRFESSPDELLKNFLFSLRAYESNGDSNSSIVLIYNLFSAIHTLPKAPAAKTFLQKIANELPIGTPQQQTDFINAINAMQFYDLISEDDALDIVGERYTGLTDYSLQQRITKMMAAWDEKEFNKPARARAMTRMMFSVAAYGAEIHDWPSAVWNNKAARTALLDIGDEFAACVHQAVKDPEKSFFCSYSTLAEMAKEMAHQFPPSFWRDLRQIVVKERVKLGPKDLTNLNAERAVIRLQLAQIQAGDSDAAKDLAEYLEKSSEMPYMMGLSVFSEIKGFSEDHPAMALPYKASLAITKYLKANQSKYGDSVL